MRLSHLHEWAGLLDNVTGGRTLDGVNDVPDENHPEPLGDRQDRPRRSKGGTPSQPRRTGNQNTPMSPRHQQFFAAPKPGDSLEDGTEADREEDGILNPGQTIRTERPVPNRAGRPRS